MNKKIVYPDCQEHTGQPKSLICLCGECRKRPMICSLCKESNHSKHHTIPLKLFINKCLTQNSKHTESQERNSFLEMVQKEFQGLLGELKLMVSVISEKMRQLELRLIQDFNTAKEAIYRHSQVLENVQVILNKVTEDYRVHEIEETISDLLLITRLQQKGGELNFARDSSQIVYSYRSSAEKLIQQVKFSLLSFEGVFKLKEKEKEKSVQDILFDVSRKPKNIIVQGLKATQSSKQTKLLRQRIVYCNQQITSQTDKFSVSFKLNKILGVVGVGLANSGLNLDKPDSDGVVDGLILLKNTGSLISQQPETKVGFIFGRGDVISLTYQPQNCQLTFLSKKFKRTVSVNKAWKMARFCVYLSSDGDRVSIHNQKKPK